MSITFWAPNPYSAPCSLPLERMNHKPTCHFSGALSDLASSVQKSHEKDPTTNFYFLTISLPLQKLDPLCLWFLGNGRSGRWSLTELGVGGKLASLPELEHSNARRGRRIWATTATRPILGELLTSGALRFQRPGFEGYKTYLQTPNWHVWFLILGITATTLSYSWESRRRRELGKGILIELKHSSNHLGEEPHRACTFF